MSARKGNPRCPACRGTGGWQGPRGWIKCACVIPSKEAREALSRANDQIVGPQLSMDEMLKRAESGR